MTTTDRGRSPTLHPPAICIEVAVVASWDLSDFLWRNQRLTSLMFELLVPDPSV
ncbi:MAG: hypothetical protein IPK13_13795 [Deltaproteobacteria bacterium]|nr:hypothetical protein [Deltaproteobacteria bacterium]